MGTETYAVAAPFTGIVSFADVFVPTYRSSSSASASPRSSPPGGCCTGRGSAPCCVRPRSIRRWWRPSASRSDGSTVSPFYGCGLAGLAGVLLGPIYAVFPTMGHDFLVMAFAVVIVGGMGSIIGAVVAALLLAQVQGLASLWIPPVWARRWSTA